MAYQSLESAELDASLKEMEEFHEANDAAPSSSPYRPLSLPPLSAGFEYPAIIDRYRESKGDRVGSMLKAMLSSGKGYEVVEEEDFEASHEPIDNLSEWETHRASRAESQILNSYASVRTSIPQADEMSIRTVSREGSMRHHPTPDLQSLQGAYVGNVKRLERTAERLSMNSDIGEELRKIRLEQKISESRQSSIYSPAAGDSYMDAISRHFPSNSSHTVPSPTGRARSGGFLPMGYVASPIGSLRSPSEAQPSNSKAIRIASQLSEPEKEGRPLDSPSVLLQSPHLRQPLPERHLRIMNEDQANHLSQPSNLLDPLERPTTALSTDTVQQASTLFADFDGVHRPPSRIASSSGDGHQVAIDTPNLTGDTPAQVKTAINDNLIYYPAPVPMMLNLPQKLSKLPSMPRGKRRTQLLGALNPAARKTVFGVDDVPEENEGDFPEKDRLSMASSSHPNLPPQLRATMFFEQPSIPQNIEIKGASAVATLDSILDASAFAPVSAFTDHPFAGRIGTDVYGNIASRKAKRDVSPGKFSKRASRSSLNLLGKRTSSATSMPDKRNTLLVTDKQRISSAPHRGFERNISNETQSYLSDRGTSSRHPREHDEEEDDQSGLEDEGLLAADEEVEDDAFQENELYDGAPTTLLAELQLRKAQQKQRNRTAVSAFPDGIHSTLLQLDAVAQVEKKKREQKRVRLAWEDPEVRYPGKENEDDEDVPLGMLFPGQSGAAKELTGRFDDNRLHGLIAVRAAEENESLSQRRSRLRGEAPSLSKQGSRYTLDLPDLTPTQSDTNIDDEETLAQRLKRLKGLKNSPNGDLSIIGDFTSEVLNQVGVHTPTKKYWPATNGNPAVDEEGETLGQRRKRLQAEQMASHDEANGETTPPIRPPINKRHSMADILHAHPASGVRSYSYDEIQTTMSNRATAGKRASVGLLQQHELFRAQTQQNNFRASMLNLVSPVVIKRQSTTTGTGKGYFPPSTHGFGVTGGGILQNGNGYTSPTTVPYLNPLAYNGSYMGLPNGTSSTMTLPMGLGGVGPDQLPLDPKQVAQIDRWRQSIRY